MRKKSLLFLLLLGGICLISSSCNTSKQVVYFQSGDTSKYISEKIIKPKTTRIKPDDILAVSVATLSEETNKIFELPNSASLRYSTIAGQPSTSQGIQPLGYLVDSTGSIDMPLVGKIKVENLSCQEVSDKIKSRLFEFVKSPSVNTRILNHKFTIIGEVNRPSTYNLYENTVTLPQAIGMAGDMTIFGRRDNVLLVREESNKRVQVRLNLLSKEILTSDYYFIKNGDLIYVEPSKVKTTYNDKTYQMVPIVTSVIAAVTSVGVLLINLTR